MENFQVFLKTIIDKEDSIQKTFDEVMKGLDIEAKFIPFEKYHCSLKKLFAKNPYELMKIDIKKIKKELENFSKEYKDSLER